MEFESDVLVPIRRMMGRGGIRTPGGTRWEAEELADGSAAIHLRFPASAFDGNVQGNLAAAPFFALCFAFWHERRTGRPTRVRARVEGLQTRGLHATRLRFVLHELAAVLPGRFALEPVPGWPLPAGLTMNQPQVGRDTPTRRGVLSESALERRIVGSPALREDFSARIAPLGPFQRQLPLGLFAGSVSSANAVLPHGAAQVDLWSTSPDGRVLHLFELKTRKNAEVGILPEALAYARLLHHLRLGRFAGQGPGLVAARRAERIVMWLVAPDYHPLVLFGDASPVTWLNEGMAADGVELRVLPFDLTDEGAITWRPDRAVPPVG
jgi:hypothetical protein